MKRKKDHSDHPEIGSKCQTYYIEKLSLAEIMKDAEDDERSKSYIVNKIIKEYYERQGRLKKKSEPIDTLYFTCFERTMIIVR